MNIKDYFVNSLNLENNDHHCIKIFPLKHCRALLKVFKELAIELDQSCRVLNTREDLEMEATVQLYLNSVICFLQLKLTRVRFLLSSLIFFINN